jgi:hypothetical protein
MITELNLLKDQRAKLRNLQRAAQENLLFLVQDEGKRQERVLRGEVELEMIRRLHSEAQREASAMGAESLQAIERLLRQREALHRKTQEYFNQIV